MAEKRKASRTAAQAGNVATQPKKDPRAKRTFRLDEGVARRYEAHCVLAGFDSNKKLNEILANYLGASYWVDRSRDAGNQAGPAGSPSQPPTGPGLSAPDKPD